MNSTNTTWFQSFQTSKEYATLTTRPIAYFCAEYAFTDHEQTYAGGLGVLAGDYLREAADQHIPLVAVGLYYREGYLHHEAFSGDVVLKHTSEKVPEEIGLLPVINDKKERIIIQIPYQDKIMYAQAWHKQMGTVALYLLDTNIAQNDIAERHTTARLYTGDTEVRFKQEMLLGIGGFRLLETLGISPIVYHMNEGHSALLSLEIAHHEMKRHGKSFMESLPQTKQRIVFTNHTLLPAGNDIYSKDIAGLLLTKYAEEIQVPIEELVSLGVIKGSSSFSMTTLALHMSGKVNAVSQLHAKKAHEIWPEDSMLAITNGIHLPTWDSKTADDSLSISHQEQKKKLLAYIAERTGQYWDENTFLLGWGRRMVSYKRPFALFEDIASLKKMLHDTTMPLCIVIAGQAHESDEQAAEVLKKLQELILGELKGSVVYLSDYNMKLAKRMVTGCDVWLNTPVVGFEACGTSGMKAALNGTLPVTTNDGWIAEVNLYEIGWLLDSDNITPSILDTLKNHVLPLYYHNKPAWERNMQHARELIQNEFSATKMLRKYIELLYVDAINTQHSV